MLIESTAKLEVAGTALVIVGDGRLRAELESQARAAGLDGRVIFTGFRDDAASIYADFDLVALTSLNEGTPLTLIEAMGCGRAVASTEVGGVADLMGRRHETLDGFTGLGSRGDRPEPRRRGVRERVEVFDRTTPAAARDGRAWPSIVSSRLSKERLVGDIEKLYCDLMAEIWRE